METVEIILRLDKMLKVCMDALEEAAEWSGKDDVNGEAGRIARETLEQLYDMYLELSTDMTKAKTAKKE